MCGRFTQRAPASKVIEHFQLAHTSPRQLDFLAPRYNVAPTQDIAVVRQPGTSGRELAMLRWGLVPSWSKDPSKGPPLINARGETVAEKPSFRTAFRRRRCLVVADGFFEWQKRTGSSRKQPYFVHQPDHELFGMAGLWETWRSRDGDGPTIESCAIITTRANDTMAPLHDRMPVILEPHDYALWLDSEVDDPSVLTSLVAPCANDRLVAEPVDTHVNSVKNDDPQCVAVQESLFD